MKKDKHPRVKGFNLFYKSNYFLIWIIIYGLLYYLSNFIISLLKFPSNYLKIICIGIIISFSSRIIDTNIRRYNFKLDFNLFIWTLIYIIILFVIEFIFNFVIINFWGRLIIIALIYTILIYLFKKIKYTTLKKGVLFVIILIVFMFLFNSNSVNLVSDNLNKKGIDLNHSEIDSFNLEEVACIERVYQIIGSKFRIEYYTNKDNFKIDSFYFTNTKENFNSRWQNSPVFKNNNTDTTLIKIKKNNIRYGENVGEEKGKLYGSLIINYDYLNKKVVDKNNIILGNNSFKISVNINDISKYFPITERIGVSYIEINSRSVVNILECNFVNLDLNINSDCWTVTDQNQFFYNCSIIDQTPSLNYNNKNNKIYIGNGYWMINGVEMYIPEDNINFR